MLNGLFNCGRGAVYEELWLPAAMYCGKLY